MTSNPHVRIRRLTTGAVRSKAGARGVRRYLVEDWSTETIPVYAFLVEQDGRRVLFDAGQTACATSPDWFPGWYPFFRLFRFELAPEDEVAPQLRALGIDPTTLRYVILSHLHNDHVGGLDDVTNAEVLVHRLEWDRSLGLMGRLRGYLPQYWPTGVKLTLVDFTGPPVGPFRGSYDVAGDETLVLVPTPGHTKGHASLLVRGGESGGWLLAGDLAHTAAGVERAAPEIAAWCRAEGVAILTTHDRDAPDPMCGGS